MDAAENKSEMTRKKEREGRMERRKVAREAIAEPALQNRSLRGGGRPGRGIREKN